MQRNQSLVLNSFSISFFLIGLQARFFGLPSLPIIAVSYYFSRTVCLLLLVLSNIDILFMPYGPLALLFFTATYAAILEFLRKLLDEAVRKRLKYINF